MNYKVKTINNISDKGLDILINNKNKNFTKFNSDAIVTRLKGIALGVVTADCVPIILFDKKNKNCSRIRH